jgi:hypothetical protein
LTPHGLPWRPWSSIGTHVGPHDEKKAAVSTTTMAASRDAAAVDELFAAEVAARQPLSFSGPIARAHKTVANAATHVLPWDVRLSDRD